MIFKEVDVQTEQFTVKNIKCGGCASAIKAGLEGLPGVEAVEVSIDQGKVTVTGEGLSRDELAAKLGELGYPEA